MEGRGNMNAEPLGGFAWTPGSFLCAHFLTLHSCKKEEPVCVALRFREDGGK